MNSQKALPAERFRFSLAHIGVNCPDPNIAEDTARLFSTLFGFPFEEGRDSIYAGPSLEIMKSKGRGRCGHLAIATDDIEAARGYLEEKGWEFDEDSRKFDIDGTMIVIYMKQEIAGFAIHLLQRKEEIER